MKGSYGPNYLWLVGWLPAFATLFERLYKYFFFCLFCMLERATSSAPVVCYVDFL